MRISRVITNVCFAVLTPGLLCSQTLYQGKVSSLFSEGRLLSDSQFGDYSPFTTGTTFLGWGLDAELPIGPSLPFGGRRFEYQPSATISIARTLLYQNGSVESQESLEIKNNALIWINRRIAAEAGYKYAGYWAQGVNVDQTSQSQNSGYTLHQSGWIPNLGIALRDGFPGFPGRLYADYVFPTGCQWTTPLNPCTTQSPRMHGLEMMQELRVNSYIRIGCELAVVRYYDASNPNEPLVPRVGHTAAYGTVHLKFEWPASSLRDRRAY